MHPSRIERRQHYVVTLTNAHGDTWTYHAIAFVPAQAITWALAQWTGAALVDWTLAPCSQPSS